MNTLTIQYENFNQLKTALIDHAIALGYEPAQVTLPLTTPVKTEAPKLNSKAKTPKAAKPEVVAETVKVEVEAVVETETTTPEPQVTVVGTVAAAATETTYNKENLNQTLKTVSQKKGMPAAIGLLKQFKASRVSDLPENKYNEFMSACLNALNN